VSRLDTVHDRFTAGRIALAYAVVGVVWVLVSDRVVAALAPRAVEMVSQSVKGVAYVLVSAGLLFVLVDRSRRELAAATDRLRTVIRASPHPVVVVDCAGRVRLCNDAAAALFGADGDGSVVGQPVPFGREGRETFAAVCDRARADGGVVDCEFAAAIDGERRTVHASATPVEDDEGDAEEVLAVFTDVTDRVEVEKRLRETNALLSEVVDASPLPTVVVDEDGAVERANPAAASLLGGDDGAASAAAEVTLDAPGDGLGSVVADALDGGGVDGEELEWEREGTVRTVRAWAAPLAGDGQAGGAVAVFEDVTDERATERSLVESERRYRTLVEMSPDPILVHRDGEILFANEALLDVTGESSLASVVGTPFTEYIPAERRADAMETARSTQRGEYSPERNPYEVQAADGTRRFVETTSRPIAFEGEPAVLTIATDVTERHEYERALRTLHDTSREVVLADSVEGAAERAADSGAELIDLDGVAVYGFDEEFGGLRPLAAPEGACEHPDTFPDIDRGDGGLFWEVYASGEAAYVPDTRADDRVGVSTGLRTVLAIPLGSHGVLATGALEPDGLSQSTRDLATVLADILRTALDRIEQEAGLRERDRRLAVQNEELERLDAVNEIVRGIARALLSAETREEVLEAVCAHLADVDRFAGAWVARDPDGSGTALCPSEAAGLSPETLDWFADRPAADPLASAVASARETGGVTVLDHLVEMDGEPDHRRRALETGYRAVAAVPIPTWEGEGEVLVVHARASDAVSDREREVFAELGEAVGAALGAVGRRRALRSERGVELDVRVDAEGFVFNRLTAGSDGRLDVRGLVPRDDGSVVGFVTVPPSLDLVALTEGWHAVQRVTALTAPDGGDDAEALYEVRVEEPFVETLFGHGAALASMSATGGVTDATVVVPEETSVRAFLEALREDRPGVDLLARREREAPVETDASVRARLESACTDRQFEALSAAHYAGFYEWPREASNADLAAALGVASPTFQAHRRAAERALVGMVLGSGG
jgi:PAS domain S-box-containing protein